MADGQKLEALAVGRCVVFMYQTARRDGTEVGSGLEGASLPVDFGLQVQEEVAFVPSRASRQKIGRRRGGKTGEFRAGTTNEAGRRGPPRRGNQGWKNPLQPRPFSAMSPARTRLRKKRHGGGSHSVTATRPQHAGSRGGSCGAAGAHFPALPPRQWLSSPGLGIEPLVWDARTSFFHGHHGPQAGRRSIFTRGDRHLPNGLAGSQVDMVRSMNMTI